MIDVLRSTRIAVGVFSASQTAALATVTAQSDTKAKKTKKPRVLETPDMGIKYIELIKGSGPFPVPGDFVVISYTGMCLLNYSLSAYILYYTQIALLMNVVILASPVLLIPSLMTIIQASFTTALCSIQRK